MFVSYKKTNGITKHFELPIPRCDDAISPVDAKSNKILISGLNAKQGCRQISVPISIEKNWTSLHQRTKNICFLLWDLGPLTPSLRRGTVTMDST